MLFLIIILFQAALLNFHSFSAFERESNWRSLLSGAKPGKRFWPVALLDLCTSLLVGLLALSIFQAAPDLSPARRLAVLLPAWAVLAFLSALTHHFVNDAFAHFPALKPFAYRLGAAFFTNALLTAGFLFAASFLPAGGNFSTAFPAWGYLLLTAFLPVYLLGLLVFLLQALAYLLRLVPLVGALLYAGTSTGLMWCWLTFTALEAAGTFTVSSLPGLDGLEWPAFFLAAIGLAALLAAWRLSGPVAHADGVEPPALVENPPQDFQPDLTITKEGATLASPALSITLQSSPFSLRIMNAHGQLLAQLDETSLTGDWLAYSVLSIPLLYTGNTFKFKRRLVSRRLAPVMDVQASGSSLLVSFPHATLCIALHTPEIVRLTIQRRASPAGGHPRWWHRFQNALSLSFPIAPDAHFLGFGQRFNRVDQRGAELYCLVEEGGFGYAGLAPLLRRIFGERGTVPNGEFCTSFPIPFTLAARENSAACGWFWNTYNPSWFKSSPATDPSARAGFTVLDDTLDCFLCAGPTPLDVISQYTSLTGRPLLPPPWVLLPWKTRTGAVTEAEVHEDISRYRQLAIPLAQVGVENWQKIRGSYEFNPLTFPNVPGLVEAGRASGYHIQIWHFPYMNRGSATYRAGLRQGYFLRNRLGLPYHQRIFHGIAAVIDYSNPHAAAWHEAMVEKALYHAGFSGTMTDYAESIPPDCTAYNGQSGLSLRNAYPVMYCQSMQRAARAARGEDYLIYPRAGYAASQRYITAQFPGDQDTDWDEGDGLPAAVRAMLNISMCGFPVHGSDIGGWFDALAPITTKELFIRWAEVGAFSPLMRAHGGVFGRNREPWKFDQETIDIYRTLSQEHVQLFPYLYSLAAAASKTGRPPVMHPALLWPAQAELYQVEDAWMLGEALYVAPIIRQGAGQREVILPGGDWWDLTGSRPVQGPAHLTVSAPLGRTPRFLRQGYPLPRFASAFDTFEEGTQARVGRLDGDLEVWLYPGQEMQPFTLFDGAEIKDHQAARRAGEHNITWKIFGPTQSNPET